MKLCPQCEFIYEDDQNFCDMDGETLVYDTRLGVLPGPVSAITGRRPTKSRLRIIALPVAAGLVLSALLCISYYASSPLLHSNFASPNRKPEVPETSFQPQIAPPLANSSSQPATGPSQSPMHPEAAAEPASIGADKSSDGLASESARSQVVPRATDSTLKTRDNRLAIAKGVPPLPQLTPLPRLPPLKHLPAAKPEAKLPGSTTPSKQGLTNQESATTSQKALVVDVKPASGNANKQSRVRAFFNKTGRVLKKPFKF